jgi:hypothetical protein
MHRSNYHHIQSADPLQNDLEFRPRARRAVKIEPPAQTVRHDVVEACRPRPVLSKWRVVKNGSKA